MRQVTLDELVEVTDRILKEAKDKAESEGRKLLDIDFNVVSQKVEEEFGREWTLEIPRCPKCDSAGILTLEGGNRKYQCHNPTCLYEFGDEVKE